MDLLKLIFSDTAILYPILLIVTIICFGLFGLVWFMRPAVVKKIAETYMSKLFDEKFNKFEKKHNKKLDELGDEFDRYKSEYREQLKDIRSFSDFKKSKVAILNDNYDTIGDLLSMATFSNLKFEKEDKITKENINEYPIVILVLEEQKTKSEELCAEYRKSILKNLNHESILIIYYPHYGHVNVDEAIKDHFHTFANSKFTLIERLHSAFLIHKIIKKRRPYLTDATQKKLELV